MKSLENIKNAKAKGVFFKYAAVGVIGTFIYLLILYLLIEILKLEPVISSTIGFVIIVIISYWLNYRWTFSSSSRHLVAFPRYATVSLVGLGLNASIMFIAVNIFNLWYGIGQIISFVVIPLCNFYLNSYWSFRKRR
jgi:putative flippase GtrA